MSSTLLPTIRGGRRALRVLRQSGQQAVRTVASAAAQKREGDISDAFASLSGMQFKPLEPRFADVKTRLIAGHEEELRDSWKRYDLEEWEPFWERVAVCGKHCATAYSWRWLLLASLREEIPLIASKGPGIVPEIDFKDIDNASEEFKAEHKKRGVAVIRGVIPEKEALGLKDELREYLRANPHTRAFPPENPQVYELYWSPSQIKARSHPNLIKAQRFLLQFWHSKDPNALISSDHPMIYADRLRMRLPGDAKFALGPHVDGGSCERWEPEGYGRGNVYESIWQGKWEEYDPWESSCRLPVVSDLYQGVGACSMFRMFQGWLSLSTTGPYEGTLLVNPLLSRATAYYLLRPFFSPKKAAQDPTVETYEEAFLSADNWTLNKEQDSWLHGATPGHGQELSAQLHPHLSLPSSMVHVPRVNPGDYVSWHCDTIHAVDKIHAGKSDSSVMYIPACPLTVSNAEFVARQREAFLDGYPCPDFGGGKGESEHIGRPGVEDVRNVNPDGGMQAFGLKEWDSAEPGLTEGQKEAMNRANKVLGFYA